MRKFSISRRMAFAILVMALTSVVSQVASADYAVRGGEGNITIVQVNPDGFIFSVNWESGNGDCRDGNPPVISHFYMSSSQPNYKQAFAAVLTAYSLNRPIGFRYFEDPTVRDATPCAIDRVSLSR